MIQEIARANDQPSVVAEHLIDRAAFGDHPLGRPVLGPEEHLRTLQPRRDRRLPPAPVGGRARRRVPRRQPRARAGEPGAGRDLRPLPVDPGQRRLRAGARRSRRRRSSSSATPTSRTCASPTGRRSTRRDRSDRAALAVYGTLLGGSMGSRLFDEIREQRGLAYSVYSVDHAFADVPILQLSAGLESGKCVEAYGRMREIVDELRTDGPTRGGGRAGARLRRRPPRARLREHERGRAPRGDADRRATAQEVDPDAAIAVLDEVTFDAGRRGRAPGSPRRPRWPASGRTRSPSSPEARAQATAAPRGAAASSGTSGSGLTSTTQSAPASSSSPQRLALGAGQQRQVLERRVHEPLLLAAQRAPLRDLAPDARRVAGGDDEHGEPVGVGPARRGAARVDPLARVADVRGRGEPVDHRAVGHAAAQLEPLRPTTPSETGGTVPGGWSSATSRRRT